MAESEIRQKLWIEKEVNLTQEECKLIKNINATLNTLTRIKPQGWNVTETSVRAKEKDYQTVVRLTELLDRNIKDMKSLILAIGINSTIAKGVQDKGKISLNNLQLYELRELLTENLIDKSNANNEVILNNILNKITETLTWDTIGDIKRELPSIQLGLYRQIITKTKDKN